MGINVRYLADTNHFPTARYELVQHGFRVRGRRQVTAIASARIGFGTVADKRSGDYATNVVLIDKLSGDITQFIQAVEAERLFMTGNLKHTIS